MNTNNRVNRLIEYVKGIKDNKNGKALYDEYREDIDNVKPQEVFEIFYALLNEETEEKEILMFLDKIINVFYKSLSAYKWEKPMNDSFLDDLIRENKALLKKGDDIKRLIKEQSIVQNKSEFLSKIEELKQFNEHYIKKENILFPYLEKRMDKFQGLSIMWALHDEVRKQINEVIDVFKNENSDESTLNVAMGKLFFGLYGLIKKEDLILFPAASEVLTNQDWYEMHKQSLEYKFPFIEKEIIEIDEETDEIINDFGGNNYLFKTETGELDFEEIKMIFNALPVDLTFVDEDNKVRYFTKPKDRIFPRSPAIIGRDVKNCHPPDSVHLVHKIIESLRSGDKDGAKFWINMKGRVLLIQYFALRNPKGEYKGVLEVSQDITEIQKLEGERRLPDWE